MKFYCLVCSHLASALPHVLHESISDMGVGRGQRVIELLGRVSTEKEHQSLMSQGLEGTEEKKVRL